MKILLLSLATACLGTLFFPAPSTPPGTPPLIYQNDSVTVFHQPGYSSLDYVEHSAPLRLPDSVTSVRVREWGLLLAVADGTQCRLTLSDSIYGIGFLEGPAYLDILVSGKGEETVLNVPRPGSIAEPDLQLPTGRHPDGRRLRRRRNGLPGLRAGLGGRRQVALRQPLPGGMRDGLRVLL